MYSSHVIEAAPHSSPDEWVKEWMCVHMHTTHQDVAQPEKKRILPFATAWIDLESIMLRKLSQRKTNNVSFHLGVESKKLNKRTN